METDLIVIKQLPVIEDQLVAVRKTIEERVNAALSLVCTEDNYKGIKKVRSELNKEFQELERRRKEVKAEILKPYEDFDAIYKECAGNIYMQADVQLKARIDEVESGLKRQKAEEVEQYFNQKRDELKIGEDLARIEDTGIRVGLSDSISSLQKKCDEFLERIAADLQVIEGLEHRDEVLTEYRQLHNLSASMLAVESRHRAIEAERKRREAQEAERKAAEEAAKQAAAQQVPPPAPEPDPIPDPVPAPATAPAHEPAPAPKEYTVVLKITTTMDGMNRLKEFMEQEHIRFERAKGDT